MSSEKLVDNGIVKMEWEKRYWLKKKDKGTVEGQFILAAKPYLSTNQQIVTVFFMPDHAFLFADFKGKKYESLWPAKDLITAFKKTPPNDLFPQGYESQVIELYDCDTETVNMDLAVKYGITEFVDEIKARVLDLSYYGEENSVDMNSDFFEALKNGSDNK